ncbi:MAG: ribosome small subunit-dependent GTPase A [Clostridia bacterium]|nr:ribosome small subunit-dependent GTPase A [Clostridia bacterium]
MILTKEGKVVKGLGGLYEVRVHEGENIEKYSVRAKGSLHRDEEKLLVGDNVLLSVDTDIPDGVVISEILPRRNSLIRPSMANLDTLFVVLAAKKPSPVLETADKLIAIAEYNSIAPVVVITKGDIDASAANEYARIYERVGIPTFVTSSQSGEGIAELSEYIAGVVKDGATAAFSGASGVGKSTLMNALFPSLSLATADISHKIERGRHTTRHVELFDLGTGFLADTPGFSLIDFERFDFFSLDSLESTFRELSRYRGKCRYSDCSHVGESSAECAVARAAECGDIEQTRLESYRSIYKTLKSKNNYT